MLHTINRRVTGCAALLTALLLAIPATAATSKTVTWKVIGVINGQAWPFTTAAYFPRPLSAGELVELTFKVDPSVPGFITGSYGSYEGAITSAKLSGSNWSIAMRAPLGRGAISIANDDPDFGDALFIAANTALLAGKTWYSFEVDLRNPGGPSPGVGPWAPFTDLTLPKAPPALGFFPNQGFYVGARRDQPGQAADGGTYSGQILSITLVKNDD